MDKVVIDGFAYAIYANHVELIGYEPILINGSKKIVIPAFVNDKPVAKIAQNALAFSAIEWIELPDTIFCIENKAFLKSEIQEVVFYAVPMGYGSLTLAIDASAFKECVNLTTFDTQQTITAGYQAFRQCPKLTCFGKSWMVQFDCIHPDAFAYSGIEEVHLSNHGWLQANSLNNSMIKRIWIKDAAKIPEKTLNYIKKKEIILITNSKSPLMDLVYEGFLVEESQVVY